ncbi:hypothetical protein A3Q33_14475 [Colwellia sp. PAMC 21821]|nr:hypothetical protein A3Q33_14475 [Colwellia sp. PAMC 21821]
MIASASASATIVEFTTSQGTFKVNLHDETTPETVTNFLKYINDGDYDNTVVHRVVPNFVMQAGGFEFTGDFPLNAIATDSAIKNEPVYSNVRGTIAMAKRSNSVNSATSQWFVNLSDNTELDNNNGGFTVFGEVIEDGMTTIETIESVSTCNINPNIDDAFNTVPMPNYSAAQCSDANFVPGVENFVTIESVVIIDTSVNTADSLAAVKNTSQTPTTPEPEKSSSGGSIAWFSLMFTGLIALRRRFK